MTLTSILMWLRRYSHMLVPIAVALLAFSLAAKSYPAPPVVHDALAYNRTAHRLVSDGVFAYSGELPGAAVQPNAIVTPGYVLVLSALYALTGSTGAASSDAVRIVFPYLRTLQLLMSLGIVASIAACGSILGGRKLALVAGLLTALYLPFGWATTVALSETLGALLVAVLLLLSLQLVRDDPAPGWRRWFLFGVVAALLALVRPVMVLWAVAPFVYLLFRRTLALQKLATFAAVSAAAFLIVLAPWVARNAIVLHQFIPLRTDAGTPMFDATGGHPLSTTEEEVYARAEAVGRDPLGAVAQYRLKLEWSASPVRFIEARGLRILSILSAPWIPPYDIGWENENHYDADRVDFGPFPDRPGRLLQAEVAATVWYQRLLLLVGVIGLAFSRRAPRVPLIASVPAYVVAVHFLTLFNDRYFFPAAPAFILLAATSGYGYYIVVRRSLRAGSRAGVRTRSSG